MSEDLDRIKSKIAKLMNLAEKATNEHEAANAAAKARSLMDKYDLSQTDIIMQDGVRHEMLETAATRVYKKCPIHISVLAVAIAQLNDCQACFKGDSMFNSDGSLGWGDKVVFRGFKRDVEFSVDMMTRLIAAVNRLTAEYLIEEGHTSYVAAIGTKFKAGCVNKLCVFLDEITKERQQITTSSGTGLVVVKSNAVSEYFGKASYSKVSMGASVKSDEDGRAFRAGQERANRVEIQRKVKA